MHKRLIEILVGLFMIAGIAALVLLAFKVSGLTHFGRNHSYVVYADFDNIGGLRERAPVRIAGVAIGRVGTITLDAKTFRAHVSLLINEKDDNIPADSSARILTEGLLGANYVSITPGFNETYLKAGNAFETTHPALVLENLVGQLLFNVKK